MNKPKLLYIDYYRGLAILLIIAGHTILWGSNGSYIQKSNLFFFTGGTFIFIFISGFLFQYLSYKWKYGTYLISKLNNVICPYFCTILPVALLFAIFNNDPNSPLYYFSPLKKFIACIFCGTIINVPTWFIGMILIFFILSPLFILLYKHKWLFYPILILSLGYTILATRPFPDAIWDVTSKQGLSFVFNFYLKLYWSSFVYFLSSYLLGMASVDLIDKFAKIKIKYQTYLLIGLVIVYFISYFYFVYLAEFKFLFLVLGFPKILMTVICLIFFKIFETKISSVFFIHKILTTLAKYSFGIFFIHQYFINLVKWKVPYRMFERPIIQVNNSNFDSLVFVVIEFLISLFGSIIVLWLIKKVLNKLNISKTRKFIGV